MALSAPQGSGDQLNPADIEGHVLIVAPVEFLPHVPTQFTKPGEVSPAIKVNVADLSGAEGPVAYYGVLWFNVKLYNGLKGQIGDEALGQMVKGQGTPGQSPPWLLLDMFSNAQWLAYAQEWLSSPAGQEFLSKRDKEVAANQQQATASGPVATPPARPVSPPPTPQPVVAAPPVATPPNFFQNVQTPAGAAPAAPAAAGVPNIAALLASLPAEEQAKFAALMAAQQGASS